MATRKLGSALTLPSTLRLTQLRAIALATGVNSGGTKSSLIALLQDELVKDKLLGSANVGGVGEQRLNGNKRKSKGPNNDENPSFSSSHDHHHILSIDMGIRNLAYCRLLVPSSKPQPSRKIVPIVKEWMRLAVTSPLAPPTPLAKEDDVDPPPPATKEAFDPSIYAGHAHDLIRSLLHPPKPSSDGPVTHILIERQRYRSMSSATVQEWTLRVNMFEAMLYAVLRTLSEEGLWKGNVWPVLPSKVWGYWNESLGGQEEVEERNGKGSKAQRTKKAKIDVVGTWADASDVETDASSAKTSGLDYQVKFEGEGVETRRRYLEKWKGKRGDKDLGKLDDLADCLLQGVAWIRWEETKRRLLQKEGLGSFLQELQ